MHKYGHIPSNISNIPFFTPWSSQSDAIAIQASARSCWESTWWQSESLAQRSPWPFPPKWGHRLPQETLSKPTLGTCSCSKKHEHIHTKEERPGVFQSNLILQFFNEGTTRGWIQGFHPTPPGVVLSPGTTWWGQLITGDSPWLSGRMKPQQAEGWVSHQWYQWQFLDKRCQEAK